MPEYVSLARAAEAAGLSSHNAILHYAKQDRIKGAIYREPSSPGAKGAWSIPLSKCEHGVNGPWIQHRKAAERRVCAHA